MSIRAAWTRRRMRSCAWEPSLPSMALASGATVDEIVGVLIAVAPTVGLARVVSAAPAVAAAIGYDIDAALEEANGKDATLRGA